MKVISLIIVVSISTLMISCTSIGPKKAKADAINYGDVIQQAQSEQLLRNIVHRSYGEPAAYVKITSITSSYSLSSSLSASPSMSQTFGGDTSAISGSFGLSPGITYSDSPTISYMPIDDSSIVSLLEQPITFEQILLLMSNGTNFMQFMGDVGFLSIGNMHNEFGANTRAETRSQLAYRNYLLFTKTVQHMVENDAVTNSMVSYGGAIGLWTQFNDNAVNSADAILIKKLLQIPSSAKGFICLTKGLGVVTKKASQKTYEVIPSTENATGDNLVSVRTRSISSIINFLSHSVQIPESDLKANFAIQRKDASGNFYNYSQALNDIILIRSSTSEPKNVYVKTFLHNRWFYIEMSDENSKYTFDMLLKLMTLALGINSSTPASIPQITIPVGAR